MKAYRSILILITSISLALSLILASPVLAQVDTSKLKQAGIKRLVVKRIEIEGVRAFPESRIRKILFTKPNHWYNFLKIRRYSLSNVIADVGMIQKYYQRRGFLFVKVEAAVTNYGADGVIAIYKVDEGKRTFFNGISITGGFETINKKLDQFLSQFELNDPVNNDLVLAGAFSLRDIYANYGYPYTRILSSYQFDDDSTKANVNYSVQDSIYTVNGKTKIFKKGFTKPYVAFREIISVPGKEYSLADKTESEQRLYSTGLFRYVSLERNDSTAVIRNDTCTVGFNLRMEERKSFYFNSGIGVGQEDNFGMVLRGAAQWGTRNISGTGRKVYLSFNPRFQITNPQGPLKSLRYSDLKKKLSFKVLRTTFEIDYVEPWTFNQRLPLDVKLSYEPYTFDPILKYRYDRAAGQLIFTKELNKTTIARLTAALDYVNYLHVPSDQEKVFRAIGENQVRRKLSFYGEHDTRGNFFVPQKGSYSFVSADFVGSFLGGDFSYLKMQFSTSRYQLISEQSVLATRIWLGFLREIGKNGKSAAADRFVIGGANTIRGYPENGLGPVFTEADSAATGKPKGGRYLMIGNIELRRPLFWVFGGSLFLDAGNTYYHFKEISAISIAFTTGAGIQIFTPIGPVRFDYGVKLKKKFDLGNGNYHLSLLYAF